MKKKGYVYGLFLLLTLFFGMGMTMTAGTSAVYAAVQNGWVTENGNTYYYQNGKKLTGKQKIGDEYYYFNSVHGYMQTGWYETQAGNLYYFGDDGVMRTGLQTIDGETYYFYTTGRVADDVIVTIDSKKYYFDENGKLYKGGWLDYKDGHTYYFYRGDGHMLKSCWITSTIDGKQYKFYVRANGYRAEGWLKNANGDYRYFLYRDGRMLTGWNTIGGKKYYFDPETGIRYEGLHTIDGKKYYFNAVKGYM